MATKSLKQVLKQLAHQKESGAENEGFSELSPEEAEELSGGSMDVGLNGACGNKGCPTSNTTCGS